MRYFFAASLLFFCSTYLNGQNYHAVQGSSLAGSLGVSNNPASIVNTPYPWDLTLFAFQLKSATNAFTIYDYSLVSSAKNTYTLANSGYYSKYADLNFNVNLLNARIALNRKQAVTFGMNLRGFGTFKAGACNYNDTLHNVTQYLNINPDNTIYKGEFNSSSWLEVFATYSQTIRDDNQQRLNAGITVKAMRGISGAFAQIQDGTFTSEANAGSKVYTLSSISGRYAYSYNYDEWQNSKSSTQNIKDFVTSTRGGFSVDLGFEYLIKPQGVKTYFDDDDYFDYDWKVGLSLLDFGFNQYRYGNQSHTFTGPALHVTDLLLDQKFDSLSSFTSFNDSIASVVTGFSQTGGKFKMQNPTRLVVNVDRSLGNDIYINGELSINLSSAFNGSGKLYVRELNFLTFTPRWETRRWGIYLPVQYNADKQFWIGGALKAGPLLFGIHNWGNVFSRNKMQNGGGYIAVVIHPRGTTKSKTDKRLNCPRY